MKGFRLLIYILVALTLIIVTVLYIYNFPNGLSNQQNDWSDFGNFFNGLVTPILAAINIIVLIQLTLTVSEIDKARTNAEIKVQKDLLILQLRKQSIETFYQVMYQYFDNKYLKDDIGKALPYVSEYIQKFLETDFHYFNFGEKESVVRRQIQSLMIEFNLIHSKIETERTLDHERYIKALEKKDEIIRLLQENALELVKS